MQELCDLLDRIAKLYQIPNYDMTVNSMLLAEWILEEYQHHQLELVQTALRKPPVLNDQAWRLTPDTLKTWIDLTRSNEVKRKEREESNERQENEYEALTDKQRQTVDQMLENYKKQLMSGFRNGTEGWRLVADKIRKEDEERLKGNSIEKSTSAKTGYISPDAEYLAEKELKRKWMLECHDLTTGRPNEKWISWEEYRMM